MNQHVTTAHPARQTKTLTSYFATSTKAKAPAASGDRSASRSEGPAAAAAAAVGDDRQAQGIPPPSNAATVCSERSLAAAISVRACPGLSATLFGFADAAEFNTSYAFPCHTITGAQQSYHASTAGRIYSVDCAGVVRDTADGRADGIVCGSCASLQYAPVS